jgi:CheY-like chemotaxis protein
MPSNGITVPARSGKTPAVLVIDDEIITRTVIADYLRDCGYRVFEAGSAEDAVVILNSELKVDIVFTDLELPGRSGGLELARWIRKHHPDMKVIVTSGAYSSAELAGELCEAGPPIVKPYESNVVVERIRNLSAH